MPFEAIIIVGGFVIMVDELKAQLRSREANRLGEHPT